MRSQESKVPLRKRLAFYGPLLLVVIGLIVATWYLRRPPRFEGSQDWLDIDYTELAEVDLLRRYVQIDTSPTTGSELAGADFLAAELEKIGLSPTIEVFGDRHANVWAVLDGEQPEALVLHNHIDVFPVENPEDWDHDPYGAVVDQAWLYGRGVFDMKSLAIVQLLALKEIIDSGRKPAKSIIFLATGSEEVGSELGTRWILEQHPELRSRFWAVLTEGGIVEPTSRTEVKYWGIEFAQKRFATGYFCAQTKEELDAIAAQIFVWRESVETLRVTEELGTFAAAYAASRHNPAYSGALESPHQAVLDGPAFRELPAYIRSLYRSEIVPFNPEPEPDGGWRMRIVLHLLPGDEPETVLERLLPPWIVHDIPFSMEPALGAASASPIDHPVFSSLLRAVEQAYPDTLVGPYLLPWSATDSRFFREAGIPSYGFSPFLIFSTDTFRVDGTNERISLPGYMSGFELYLDSVRRITR